MKRTLPSHPYGVLRGKALLLYAPGLRLAELLGLWRYPADIDQNFRRSILHRYLRLLYRRYKSTKPILKAESGSGLEAYFAENRRLTDGPLLPRNFRPQTSAVISAVGDLMGVRGLENSKDRFYAKLSELIFGADISLANLESPVVKNEADFRNRTGPRKHRFLTPQPKLFATPAQFDAFKGHGNNKYTIFCTANNHLLDYGMAGFDSTHDRLEREQFRYVGSNRSPEGQRRGLTHIANGIKLGLVAATYRMNNRGEGHYPEDLEDHLVNVVPFHSFRGKVDLTLLEDQIAYCRSQNCDFVILSLHWGMEFEFFPRMQQVHIAHHLIETGADAIVSHHAHNIQPYELYQTQRDPDRVAPIFYGLGNLTSLWSAPYSTLSLIINLTLVKGRIGGIPKTLVERADIVPVLQTEGAHDGIHYLQIEKLNDLIKSDSIGSDRAYFKQAGQYADLVLGEDWRG